MTVIVPIILKFIPLFMIIYYVLGVFAMEVLYDASLQAASSLGHREPFVREVRNAASPLD